MSGLFNPSLCNKQRVDISEDQNKEMVFCRQHIVAVVSFITQQELAKQPSKITNSVKISRGHVPAVRGEMRPLLCKEPLSR